MAGRARNWLGDARIGGDCLELAGGAIISDGCPELAGRPSIEAGEPVWEVFNRNKLHLKIQTSSIRSILSISLSC